MPASGEAEEIADDLLYRTGKAVMSGDFASFRDCCQLPLMMQTIDDARLIKTGTDLEKMFDSVRRYYMTNDVHDIVRTVISSEFFTSDEIGSTHVTRLIKSDGSEFRAPYPAYSVLKRSGGAWRIAIMRYAILDDPRHNAALMLSPKTSRPVA
jgi:hypothetical protein